MAVKRFPIEATHIMMFARSINDANPIYYDEEHAKKTEPGGSSRRPLSRKSAQFDPDYFLRPKVDQPGSGRARSPPDSRRAAAAVAGRWLHAEQEFIFHRHGQPRRRADGGGQAREGVGEGGQARRQAQFRENIVEYRDQKGELVITARGVGVQPEKVVEQVRRIQMALKASKLKVGDEHRSRSATTCRGHRS